MSTSPTPTKATTGRVGATPRRYIRESNGEADALEASLYSSAIA